MKPNGFINKHKARLVTKGFHQQLDIDYINTFNLILKQSTSRLVFSLSGCHKWSFLQINIQNAFLHDKLTKNVFMQQPQWFVDSQQPDLVCKLNKSIQALKAW